MLQGRLYFKTIIWQGDPNAAPVNSGGPVPTRVVAQPVEFLPWRSTAITRIGDPNAAPVVPGATSAPLVVTTLPQSPVKGGALLSAAAADFAFSGPLVSSPLPQPAVMVAPIITRQLQDGASVVATPTPSPIVILPVQAPAPRAPVITWQQLQDGGNVVAAPTPAPVIVLPEQAANGRPQVITWRQLQDGFVAPTTGPVPFSLVVSPFVPPGHAPAVISIVGAPAPSPPTITTAQPLIVVPRMVARRWTRIVRQAPFVASIPPIGPPHVCTPALLTLYAHTSLLALDASIAALVLDAHSNGLTLDC